MGRGQARLAASGPPRGQPGTHTRQHAHDRAVTCLNSSVLGARRRLNAVPS